MSKKIKAIIVTFIALALVALFLGQNFFLNLPSAFAQAEPATSTPTAVATPTSQPQTSNPHTDPTKCLACHSEPSMMGQFPDGKTISLSYDPTIHKSGHMPSCVACHEKQRSYPHENSKMDSCSVCHWQQSGSPSAKNYTFKLSYEDARALSLEINASCKKCHKEKFTESSDSIHRKIFDEGNRYAPVCVDCHSSHDIVPGSLTHQSAPIVCSKCHLSTYTAYMSSVHGTSPSEASNADVPTCEDCHGVHNVHGPSDTNFRANSIETCGNCHSDPKRMAKYGISTNVLQTYLDDFHGRSVDYDRKSSAASVPEATCYDCHGIHNVKSPKDASSTVYPTNLQHTCQQCHSDAAISFPQAWLGHSKPDLKKTPILFAVNWFYQLSIPAVLVSIGTYILLDAQRRVFDRFKTRNSKRDS